MNASTGSFERPSPARAGEGRLALVVAVVATGVLGFVVPGLGIAIAAALALAPYRGHRRAQAVLLAVGVGVTALALLAWALVLGGGTALEQDEPVRVRP